MEELYHLIDVLKQVLEYSAEDFDRFKMRLKGREKNIFTKVLADRNLSDEDIFEELEFNYASDPNYRRYKREIKSKLIQEVLQYSPSYLKHSPYYSAFFSCQQIAACVNSLRALSIPSLASKLCEPLFSKCVHFHFTSIASEMALFLSRYYRLFNPDKKKAEYYSSQCKELTKILGFERNAEMMYNEVTADFILHKSYKPKVVQKAKNFVADLHPYASLNLQSTRFYLSYFSLKLITAEGDGDYTLALDYSRQALAHFSNLKFDYRQGRKIFYRNVANNLIQLGHFMEAKQVIERSLSVQIKGREKWYMALYQMMQIEIHSNNYSEAYRIYSEMRGDIGFENLPTHRQDLFKLYGAYLDFLAMVDMVPAVPVPTRFKINKFINEVPEFDRDSRGMKIPLIIAQLLYFIYDRNYDAMEQRLYALKQYCSIHLRRESPNFRSNCFIKMLLTIPVNNFNPVAVKRKAEKFVKRLAMVPFAISQQPAEIEIVPYEHLWDIVLTHLSAPKRKRKHAMDKELFRVKGVE